MEHTIGTSCLGVVDYNKLNYQTKTLVGVEGATLPP